MSSDRPTLSYRNTDVTLLEWIVAHVALLLPLVNVFCLLRWSFSRQTKVSLQNYARSLLVFLILSAAAFVGLSSAGIVDEARLVSAFDGARSALAPPSSAEPFEGAAPRYRTFTSVEGRSMQAIVVGFDADKVVVERVDGEVFQTDIGRFSESDRAYLAELRSRLGSGRKVADSESR